LNKIRLQGYTNSSNKIGGCFMDNNKNRMKDREKSNPELRKMDPTGNADHGIINGQVIGVHEGKHEKSRSGGRNKNH
jgi:hypothetical protein